MLLTIPAKCLETLAEVQLCKLGQLGGVSKQGKMAVQDAFLEEASKGCAQGGLTGSEKGRTNTVYPMT